MTNEISNMNNVIDIREVIERIEELRNERDSFVIGAPDGTEIPDAYQWAFENSDGAQELAMLEALTEECKGNGGDEQWDGDWYPITLIRDSYFKDYAQELAEDIGATNPDAQWPHTCIDWDQAARELQYDYTGVEFDGVTYWVRGS